MRILVTWVSKRGGTESIGRIVAGELEARGFDVVAKPASLRLDPGSFDAAIIGGAIYANRWPRALRRFVNLNTDKLRRIPVWLFSSGPLDDSADRTSIAPTKQVTALAERVGALDHVTFGGRLEADAKGFPASAMARKRSGDWRNPDRVREWAAALAAELPNASPGRSIEQPARSVPRLIEHGLLGWVCTAVVLALLMRWSVTAAMVTHAVFAPLLFVAIALHYFRAKGAREALPTAFVWTVMLVVFDFLVIGLLQDRLGVFASIAGMWLPFALVFIAVWVTGEIVSMAPLPETPPKPA